MSPPTYPSSCTGAVDTNYAIGYVNGAVTIAKGLLTITCPSPTMPDLSQHLRPFSAPLTRPG